MTEKENETNTPDSRDEKIWILVDHSAREASLLPVARSLEERGLSVELVTITEVIGSVAREALAGGAERLLRGLRVAISDRGGDEDLVGAIRRRQPDVLVVTEARYARAIGVLENLTGVQSLQVGLVPDFYVGADWFNGQLHAFIVPDEKMRDEIADRGVSEERIRVAGPALRPGFGDDVDRSQARSELGLDEDQQVVLVRASGFDAASLEKLVFQSTLCDRNVRFIFHHDDDGATASTLRRAADEYGLPAAMFGRVSDLERYFAAADAILAADEEPYLAEVLESGTPALILSGERQQPLQNGAALAERGLVNHLDDLAQLGTRLDRFLEPENLEELRVTLREWNGVARHEKLVEVLEEVADQADEWRIPARPTKSDDDVDEEGQEEPEASGPFESIGSRGGGERASGEQDGETPARDASRRGPADFSSLSRAEAKEQLAELILKERKAERRCRELEKQQERWRGRLELARDWNETDLIDEAESILRGYIDEAKPLERELRDIRRQKEKLKAAARSGEDRSGPRDNAGDTGERPSRMEERFQKMEVDRDLEGLKDRIRRELGE